MKKIILLSLIAGIALTAASLLIIRGEKIQMRPCVGVGKGCVVGIIIHTPTEVIGQRGYPLTMVYLQTDEDAPDSVYYGYSVLGIVGNLLIYFVVGLAAVSLVNKFKIST